MLSLQNKNNAAMWGKTPFIFSFILIMLGSNIALAQQEFTLNGVVFEHATKIRIALAEVKNKRSGFSTGSNDLGIFSISASIGDTLLFTKSKFIDLEVVVRSDKDVVLYLNKGATTLNEVVVKGQTKKQTISEIKRDFKGKGTYYGGKPPFLSFIFSPLTAIYELVGKTPRQARRFNRMAQTELQDSQVDQLFNKTTINQQTGLEGKALENFLVYYRPSYEQAKNWNTYDAIKWINESYKRYSDTASKIKK